MDKRWNGGTAKGPIILQAYDALGRPTHLWARDHDQQSTLTLRQYLQYGDEISPGARRSGEDNLLGKLYRHYDEAGLQSFHSYDFKGNLLQKSRRVIRDERLTAVMGEPADPTFYGGLDGRLP